MPETIQIGGKEIPVEQFRNDWAIALMSRGVVVKLSISRWRATAKLTPEMLGLRFADQSGFDFMKKYIDLGKQKLLPPETLKEVTKVENEARTILNNHSFETVWGRFVPFTAFSAWEIANKDARRNFMEEARILGDRYPYIINSVKTEYRKMAHDVWIRLYPEDKAGPTQSFIEEFVDKVISQIPSQEEIVSSFSYETEFFYIPMPSFVAENIAKTEQIIQQTELANLNHELEIQTRQRIADEYVRRKGELIDNFLNSTVSSMRDYVSELCTTILKSIGQTSSTGDLTTSHYNKLKEMVNKVKLLNFYDDKEISKLTLELETEIYRIKGEEKNDVIIDKLKEIVEVTKKEFNPKYFSPSISTLEP